MNESKHSVDQPKPKKYQQDIAMLLSAIKSFIKDNPTLRVKDRTALEKLMTEINIHLKGTTPRKIASSMFRRFEQIQKQYQK